MKQLFTQLTKLLQKVRDVEVEDRFDVKTISARTKIKVKKSEEGNYQQVCAHL